MKSTELRTVLLYNHATGTGHHESWTALFAALLIDRGYRVVCITPDTVALESVLIAQGVVAKDSIELLPMPPIVPPPPTFRQKIKMFLRRLKHKIVGADGQSGGKNDSSDEEVVPKPSLLYKWRILAPLYASHAPEVQVTADLPAMLRLKKQLLHLLVPPVWHITQAMRSCAGRHKYMRPFSHIGERSPINLALAAQLAFRRARWKPDFMLSMYADIWMTSPRYWPKGLSIPVPWGGIRFNPFPRKHAGREGYFRDQNFCGLCFLDEGAVADYRHRKPDRFFEFFPDVANADLPISNMPLTDELRRRAGRRKIVLLCGSIEGRKNIGMFCELARVALSNQFFFAIVGQVHPSTLTTEDKTQLASFVHAEPHDTFFRDVYFEEERNMNAVIECADILFAVYQNFGISSNMLSKAAAFDKPILVARDCLMGRRVEQYGIGVAIGRNDARLAAGALVDLSEAADLKENFKSFRDKFSNSALQEKCSGFIERCIRNHKVLRS